MLPLDHPDLPIPGPTLTLELDRFEGVRSENGQETDTIYLSDQSGRDAIEIGRDSPDIAGGIRIKDKTNTVSRRQARLLYSTSDKQFKLVNLAPETSNPTMINGRQMSGDETVVLNDNDVLRMGNVELKFRKPS